MLFQVIRLKSWKLKKGQSLLERDAIGLCVDEQGGIRVAHRTEEEMSWLMEDWDHDLVAQELTREKRKKYKNGLVAEIAKISEIGGGEKKGLTAGISVVVAIAEKCGRG